MRDVVKRFNAKVDRSGGLDACWIWLGATGGEGRGGPRGIFWFEGKCHIAARIAWWIEKGKHLPDELMALHKCDNPMCVNVSHLFPGTQSDNIQDCHAKGRNKGGRDKYTPLCKFGHEYTPENTYVNACNGQRVCKECRKGWSMKYRNKS